MGEVLITRRGGSGSGSNTVTFTSLIPSGNETITYTGTESGTVNIVNGTGSIRLPSGTYTFASSDTCWTSGTAAIAGDTAINCWYGTPVYWYGNMLDSGGWHKGNSSMGFDIESNRIGVSSGATGTHRHLRTINTYDFTGFSYLRGFFEHTGNSSYYAYIGYGTEANAGYNYAIQSVKNAGGNPAQILGIALEQHPTAAYLYFGNNTASVRSYLYALWLD